MKLKFKKVYFRIEELFVIFIFVMLLSSSARIYFNGYILCYSFIVFHECAHMLMAGIFGDKLTQVSIRLSGMNAVIKVKNELHPRWFFIYLAGPISNLLLAFLFYKINIVRDVNIGLAIINLLPIYPLDGFNILQLLCSWCISKRKSQIILNIIQKIILFIIIVLGITVFVRFKNPSIIIFIMYIFFLTN